MVKNNNNNNNNSTNSLVFGRWPQTKSFLTSPAHNLAILSQMVCLGIFVTTIVPNSRAVTGNQTHGGRVEPDWIL